jgi:flagellar hook-associated protein 3 FlgL
MSITGPGSITSAIVMAQNNIMKQLNSLSEQLATGKAAQTYSDLSSQAGVVLALNGQLSAINGFTDSATTVGTTLTIAQSVLSQLSSTGGAVVQSIEQQPAFTLDANGQTITQETAASQLDQIVSLLNTQAGGNNYIFSGNGLNQPAVASATAILNGSGTQAGLKQVVAERQQADVGANGLGRLVIPPAAGSVVSVSEDVAGSPFGFKLASVNSSLTGATVTGPAGSPAAITVTLGAVNPNPGDTIQFNLTLPDGSSQSITLQATTASPPDTNQFTIGATPAATAANLQAALSTAVGTLAQTALPAASALAAANNFFQSNPPLRVNGPPFNAATSLVNGTAANTVFWYTGENGPTPARQTATAEVGPSMTVSYGMRANEQALTTLVSNVALLASTTYAAGNPNASISFQDLSQQVSANLVGQSGMQSISNIQADLANAQTTIKSATDLNAQTQTTLQSMLQNIDGVNDSQVGEQILNLQNSLSASMSVTARLAQMSLVNFLAPVTG